MKVLGISCFYHDSAAALIDQGRIVAAAHQERFTRKKHDPRFPAEAINYCLKAGNISLGQVDAVVFYEKPFLKFERLLETYLSYAPKGFSSFRKAIPLWITEKVFMKKVLGAHLTAIDAEFDPKRLFFSDHHLSHAASAFYPSPFDEAVVLTMDGVGEWATASLGIGRGNVLELQKEIHFPHSLGLLYSAFTYFCGFKVNSGEYKLMGLAPYGEPVFAQTILEKLVDVKADGSFRLNLEYFDYPVGLRMTSEKFHKLFELKPRRADELMVQKHMDLAASVQAVTEGIMLKMVQHAVIESGLRKLCLAGGVALNCVANGKILKHKLVDDIWIQPAAGDAGGSLGAALAYYHLGANGKREPRRGRQDDMQGAYLGPAYSNADAEAELRATGARFERLPSAQVLSRAAKDLADGKALGWFQGRMEWGPRSLGARSIIADARSPKMQTQLNLKVKFRESFRPFAPAVLAEKVSEWFDLNTESPYMLLVADVLKKHQIQMTEAQKALFGIEKLNIPRSSIPAVTHIDYSARVQTVHAETNAKFHALISEFDRLTGCPVLVNTSFNVRGEPIVCSPTDAFRCFMGSDIDVLVIEDIYLRKEDQDPALAKSYKDHFELD